METAALITVALTLGLVEETVDATEATMLTGLDVETTELVAEKSTAVQTFAFKTSLSS